MVEVAFLCHFFLPDFSTHFARLLTRKRDCLGFSSFFWRTHESSNIQLGRFHTSFSRPQAHHRSYSALNPVLYESFSADTVICHVPSYTEFFLQLQFIEYRNLCDVYKQSLSEILLVILLEVCPFEFHILVFLSEFA